MTDENLILNALAKAKQGSEQDSIDLLRLCYDHLHQAEQVAKAAVFLQSRLVQAPAYRRYQIAGLFVNLDMRKPAYEMLVDLSWDDRFAPAQWRLGRMVVDQEFDELDENAGMDLLLTAAKAGHLRATAEWHRHKARMTSFPTSLIHWLAYRIFVFRTVWRRDICGKKDQTVL